MRVTTKRNEYHLRRYRRAIRNGSDVRVLSKYSRLILSSRRSELLRHTCHVCAWVLGLSVEQSVRTRDDGLSPIGVLIKMLQSRGPGSLPQRLQSSVERLRVRIDAVLNDPSHRDSHTLWQALKNTLPKVRKTLICLDMEEDALTSSSLEKYSDGNKHWRRALKKYVLRQTEFRLLEDQGASVEALFCKARIAYDESDAMAMCDLLLRAVALLNRPRLLNSTETGQAMCDAARERLSACLQTKVRNAVILCLQGLDFSHEGTLMRADVQVATSAIARILEGIDLQRVKASKQWSDIKSLLDTVGARPLDSNRQLMEKDDTMLHQQRSIRSSKCSFIENKLHRKQLAWNNDESEKLRQVVESHLSGNIAYTSLTLSDWRNIAKEMDIGKSGSSLKAHYRNMVDPRYMKVDAIPEGLKHRGGVLKLMMTKAMIKLGGEATMPEIIEYCKTDERIQQEFGPQLIYHKTKVNGTTRELPLWEATAATNSSNMFKKTGERRQKHAVWTLK